MSPTPPTNRLEATRLSWGLLSFYASCAGVALAATVAAAGYMWFDSVPALVVGGAFTVLFVFTCLLGLRAARAGR